MINKIFLAPTRKKIIYQNSILLLLLPDYANSQVFLFLITSIYNFIIDTLTQRIVDYTFFVFLTLFKNNHTQSV